MVLALIFVPAWALAEDTVALTDGEEFILDLSPVSVDGRTLVPIRPLLEVLGASVHWDSATNTVTFYMDDNEIHITIEGHTALIDGEKNPVDVPARLIDGYTFVPLRFIGENLGYTVHWESENRIIKIVIPKDCYESETRTIKIFVPENCSVEITIIYSKTGIASWYGGRFHGRRTANGEIFNQHELTAAHRTLPFGTLVNVTSVDTGQSVQVRINDRGPFTQGRIIDLSAAAADAIGLKSRGIGEVRVDVLASE